MESGPVNGMISIYEQKIIILDSPSRGEHGKCEGLARLKDLFTLASFLRRGTVNFNNIT